MCIHDDFLFYAECWLDLRSFLLDLACDKPDKFPYAHDVLELMQLIQSKYDSRSYN